MTLNLTEKIEHLYQQSPVARLLFAEKNTLAYWYRRVEELKERFPRDLSLATLDLHEKEHARGAYSPFLELVSYLPADIVFEEFGEEVLFWASCHAPPDRQNVFVHQLAQLTRKNSRLLLQAQHTWERISSRPNCKVIQKTYNFLEFMQLGNFPLANFKEMLQASAFPGVVLSPQRLRDYHLERMSVGGIEVVGPEKNWAKPNGRRNLTYGLYLDAPLALGLMYKNEPQAVSAFCLEDEETLLIRQLQGVRKTISDGVRREIKSTRNLAPLDWVKLLVQCTAVVASSFGIAEIGIQGAVNNTWARHTQTSPYHLDPKKALARYDQNAERLGFQQRDNGNWYISVEKLSKKS